MYDDPGSTPTADGAQSWLSIQQWLREKRQHMVDKFLQDFTSPWRGERDARPPKEVHDETVTLTRKQQKASSSFTVGGIYCVLDENGHLSMQQNRAHMFVNSDQVAAFVANLNAIVPTPDPAVVDLNTDGPVGLNLPQTASQISMRQNELALRASKQRR